MSLDFLLEGCVSLATYTIFWNKSAAGKPDILRYSVRCNIQTPANAIGTWLLLPQVTAVSDELPLVFNATFKAKTAFIAFACGLDVSPSGQVLITYGSADIESRILMLSVAELEGMFTGAIAFREVQVPYKPVEVNLTAVQSRAHAQAQAQQQLTATQT